MQSVKLLLTIIALLTAVAVGGEVYAQSQRQDSGNAVVSHRDTNAGVGAGDRPNTGRGAGVEPVQTEPGGIPGLLDRQVDILLFPARQTDHPRTTNDSRDSQSTDCSICGDRSSHRRVIIPSRSHRYRRSLVRSVQSVWGLDGPSSRHAAQIHAESSWRPNAASHVAHGLAQFTWSTARWISKVYPALGHAAPYSPDWAIAAQVRYNYHLYVSLADVSNECDRWAMVLSAYNGGPGWLRRDRVMAAASGADEKAWWGSVERYSPRAEIHRQRNRAYVADILCRIEPAYVAAGWGGNVACQ